VTEERREKEKGRSVMEQRREKEKKRSRVREKRRRSVMEQRGEKGKMRKQSRCPALPLFTVVCFSFIVMSYRPVFINKVQVLVLTLSDTYFHFLLKLFAELLVEVQAI
jgi:hypothetical protein